MSTLSEELDKLHKSVLDLKVTDLSDQLVAFKQRIVPQACVPLTVKCGHKGTAQASLKVDFHDGNAKVTIYIDDLLEGDHEELGYYFTNFDPKEKDSSLGMIYQSDQIIRMESMKLDYAPSRKQYMLEVPLRTKISVQRIFIVVSFILKHGSIHHREVHLEPSTSGPCSGSESRSTHL